MAAQIRQAKINGITIHRLPDNAADGNNFKPSILRWQRMDAQFADAGMQRGRGEDDGVACAHGTPDVDKQAVGAAIFKCLADAPLEFSGAQRVIEGLDMRNCVFQQCAPKGASLKLLNEATAFIDQPTFKHGSVAAWMRELRYMLHVVSTFATAQHVPNPALRQCTEADVIATLNGEPRDGMPFVPWGTEVAKAVADPVNPAVTLQDVMDKRDEHQALMSRTSSSRIPG